MKYLLLFFLTFATAAVAVEADETFLADARQEQTARDIMRDLRCLVCRNESIIDSHADLARDLRNVVRERVAAGDTPEQVKHYMTTRYGEWILLKPEFSGLNIALWLAPALLLVTGVGIVLRRARRFQPDNVTDEQPE